MQSGNVGNLLRRVPLSDGTMQNGRSCFRSLDDEHYGKLCPNSKICGKNGCQEIHHRLLHQHNRRTEPSSGNAKDHTAPKHVDAGQGEPRADRGTLEHSLVNHRTAVV